MLWAVSVSAGVRVKMDAHAAIGPGNLHSIVAEGVFSTDPKIPVQFNIAGTISLSAITKLDVNVKGYVAVSLLSDQLLRVVSTAVDLNGSAELQAQVDATPSIQRRPAGGETAPEPGQAPAAPAPGSTPASEFVIAGHLAAGAALNLGIYGGLVLELLNHEIKSLRAEAKKYPLGQVGMTADVSCVLGADSKVDFDVQPAPFDARNFVDGLLQETLPERQGEQREKTTGTWTNTGGSAPGAGQPAALPPAAPAAPAPAGQAPQQPPTGQAPQQPPTGQAPQQPPTGQAPQGCRGQGRDDRP